MDALQATLSALRLANTSYEPGTIESPEDDAVEVVNSGPLEVIDLTMIRDDAEGSSSNELGMLRHSGRRYLGNGSNALPGALGMTRPRKVVAGLFYSSAPSLRRSVHVQTTSQEA